MKRIDLVGQRFGSLVATRRLRVEGKGNGRRTIWLCICDCGNTSEVSVGHLRSSHSLSCGCRRVLVGRSRIKHGCARGDGRRAEYGIWHNMLRRCADPSNPAYQRYGGRGILVCREWRESFVTFLQDMGFRPSSRHTLERVNNDIGYSRTNCVWATRLEQGRNKRNNRLLNVEGVCLCLQEWSEKSGVSRETIAGRLDRDWSTRRAIFTPVVCR